MGVGRRVNGEGATPNWFCVIGEHPGRAESVSGRPFSGAVGKEIDRFFNGARLPDRHDIFLTTWIREWCGEDGTYLQADYDRDEPLLCDELRQASPTVIVTLGRHITRWFLGDVDMDDCHGFAWNLPADSPRRVLFQDPDSVVIFAGFNPGAAFRNPALASAVAYDFANLEAFVAGRLPVRRLYDDPFPTPDYRDLTSAEEVDHACRNGIVRISTDTEGWPSNPWSVQLSTVAGTASVIRARNKEALSRFVWWVQTHPYRFRFVFHAALHDLAMYRAMGIDVRHITFDDTSIMAYNLQVEPVGLKPLCVRFAGMAMQSYDEIMGDAGFQLAQDWLLSAHDCEEAEWMAARQAEFDRLTTTPYTNKAGKVVAGRKLKVLPKLPKAPLFKSIERCLRSKDPRKLWADQTIDRQVEAFPKYGEMWEATLDHVPLDKALHYAARDADGTGRIEPILRDRLKANNLEPVYEADLATVPLIDRMQQIGIKPSLPHFAALSKSLENELIDQRVALADLLVCADVFDLDSALQFNANSTYQVGDLLYKRFNLPILKETEGGDPSTNNKILEALQKSPDIPPDARAILVAIRDYRETYKLKHTFTDRVPDYVNRWPFDGRIHTTYRITRIPTGRLAAADPNLLAMPKKGRFATAFREGFVAEFGHLLTSHDQSQIELRGLAHLSRDAVLLAAFIEGLDLHAKLAQRIFGGKEADYKKGMQRTAAKAINFGIPMGMTNIGLCIELKKNGLDVDEDDAQRWLDETMALYASVPIYQQEKQAEARRLGYVTDILGRRFYLGGIRSTDRATRSEAERQAGALPIQATAQEVMKCAEKYVWNEIILPRQARGEWIEPVLQIHDDLILEVAEELVADVHEEMVVAMTQAPAHMLCVPLATSGDCGASWGAMHEIPERKAA